MASIIHEGREYGDYDELVLALGSEHDTALSKLAPDEEFPPVHIDGKDYWDIKKVCGLRD